MTRQITSPRITFAVQGYRNPEMLRLCLDSIRSHGDLENNEAVISDSATQTDTIMMMSEDFPDFHFFPHEENVGFGKMVNVCIANARGDYIFIMNPDTILEEDTVAKLLEFMDTNQHIGMCGPAQKNFNGKKENTRFDFYKPLTILYRRTFLKKFSFAKKHLAEFEMKELQGLMEPYPVPWVIGSAMFARKRFVDKVGGMDPRFFMYMEDIDWCRRFWEHDFPVYYHPEITLFHFYGKGSASGSFFHSVLFNRLTWVHISSAIKYFLKYNGRETPVISQGEYK